MRTVKKRTNAKRFGPVNVGEAPDEPGVYVILDRNKQPQYVGSSERSLRERVQAHLREGDIPDSRYFRTYTTTPSRARALERRLFRKLNPPYNAVEP